jgi:hypothetical protein
MGADGAIAAGESAIHHSVRCLHGGSERAREPTCRRIRLAAAHGQGNPAAGGPVLRGVVPEYPLPTAPRAIDRGDDTTVAHRITQYTRDAVAVDLSTPTET